MMVQTAEAEAFLARVVALPKGPGIDLDVVLQPSLDDEMELRRLLATDRSNTRLSNPYVGLIDVFDAPSDIRTTRARVIKDDQELNAKHVMPLPADKRRKEGESCMVADLGEFRRNWGVFTEGSLSQLVDWSNVIAAGGSVLACLSPLSAADKASKRAIRKHYHSAAYPTSDVDLFLWGLTPEQAEKKIVQIYEAVRDSVPWDVTCVRTRHTISIHSQYPYRSVQIVLRLYHSPAEVLAGFDIDAPCCAYDGTRVWANPRAIAAMMRQCNTTDVTRRSPSYEVRLSKYAKRGFEVYVPSLIRADIDPTIFERSIVRVEGLARLLVLERLATFDERQKFLRTRRELRGRPAGPRRFGKSKRKYKNDLKTLGELEELEMNNYDVTSLHIPYGPGWDARRIDKLIYQTDLGMNSTFNPKNKGRRLHRHPAFFGTIEECIEDCCESCPEAIDEAERELQTKEDEIYIRGRVTFMQENPGRQVITGSFNPIDVGEWSAQVHIGPTDRFFAAIAAHDRTTVANMVSADVNRRDHVGRSPLQFAILCNATEIACDLVDAGARMTARLVDGRTSLHLAVQYDQAPVVRKLLERSAQNKEGVGAETEEVEMTEDNEENESERARLSSEDDWSSEDDGAMEVDDDEVQANEEGGDEDKDNEDNGDGNEDEGTDDDEGKGKGGGDDKKKSKKEDEPTPVGDEIPDDNTKEPDVLDLSAADWDFGLTPLAYAVIFASLPIIEDLIATGANVKESTQNDKLNMHPLTLTILRPDEDEACKIAERLILAGATSSPAGNHFRTIFCTIVASKKVKLASTIMKCDPTSNTVLNFPSIQWSNVVFPIVLAIHERQYAMVAALLAYGAKLDLVEKDITRAIATRPQKDVRHLTSRGNHNIFSQTYMPVETALVRHDDIAQLLISLGANINTGLRANNIYYTNDGDKLSILDWIYNATEAMEKMIQDKKKKVQTKEAVDFSRATSWKEYALLAGEISSHLIWASNFETEEERLAEVENIESIKQYFEDVKKLLVSVGAKTWAELQHDVKPMPTSGMALAQLALNPADDSQDGKSFEDCDFLVLSPLYYSIAVPRHLVKRYHELCEACFTGDNAKIQALCLPPEEAQGDELPLQITVQLRDPSRRYTTGVTPFSIAVDRRKWDTARLILAIAVAQYEVEETEVKFSVDHMDLDDDGLDDGSDDGTDYSDCSDDTVGQKENYYVDVAKRPSIVKCDVKPGLFFTRQRRYGYITDDRYLEETVFDKAIREGDLEAFVKLLNMLVSLPIPEDVPSSVAQQVLAYDRYDMLDELIRHTGTGIDLKTVRCEAKDVIPANDGNRLYLGLNVHGKKRADLARKNDPNAGVATQEPPLLWAALVLGAEKIVDYLASDGPYSAYHSYAMSHSDERAERLRSIEKLKEFLPQWLGFRTNSFGESALTAAVLSGKVDLLKVLYSKHKNVMKGALHDKYKPTNSNMLHIAVRSRKVVDTELLDFLLAKDISPLETESTGCNIYHILCQRNNYRLLRHLLEKLPREINEALFKQQARHNLNTPLNVAVKTRAIKTVEMLLAHSHVANTIRDSEGCLPLHNAIRQGCPRIAKLLIDGSPSTLFVEDGVGSTALESAALIHFRERMSSFTHATSFVPQIGCAEPKAANITKDSRRFDLQHLEKELPLLRKTIDSLLKVGKLRKDTKLEKELVEFAERMEEHMRRLQQAPVVVKMPKKTDKVENAVEVIDRSATYEVVMLALKHVKGERELVHLIDVQKLVGSNMTDNAAPKRNEEDDMNVKEKEKEFSFVRAYANIVC